jgi:hypothetical protein
MASHQQTGVLCPPDQLMDFHQWIFRLNFSRLKIEITAREMSFSFQIS